MSAEPRTEASAGARGRACEFLAGKGAPHPGAHATHAESSHAWLCLRRAAIRLSVHAESVAMGNWGWVAVGKRAGYILAREATLGRDAGPGVGWVSDGNNAVQLSAGSNVISTQSC